MLLVLIQMCRVLQGVRRTEIDRPVRSLIVGRRVTRVLYLAAFTHRNVHPFCSKVTPTWGTLLLKFLHDISWIIDDLKFIRFVRQTSTEQQPVNNDTGLR